MEERKLPPFVMFEARAVGKGWRMVLVDKRHREDLDCVTLGERPGFDGMRIAFQRFRDDLLAAGVF